MYSINQAVNSQRLEMDLISEGIGEYFNPNIKNKGFENAKLYMDSYM